MIQKSCEGFGVVLRLVLVPDVFDEGDHDGIVTVVDGKALRYSIVDEFDEFSVVRTHCLCFDHPSLCVILGGPMRMFASPSRGEREVSIPPIPE